MTSAHVATLDLPIRWDRGSAVSDVAAHLQALVDKLFRSADGAQTLSWRETAFENRLRASLHDVHVDDDQCAVSTVAVQLALWLVRSLPNNISVPDVAIDQDGEVALDWMPSRTRMFSISIGDSDRVAYAWVDGSDRSHGVFRFTGAMPRPLLMQLAELISDDNASVRVA